MMLKTAQKVIRVFGECTDKNRSVIPELDLWNSEHHLVRSVPFDAGFFSILALLNCPGVRCATMMERMDSMEYIWRRRWRGKLMQGEMSGGC